MKRLLLTCILTLSLAFFIVPRVFADEVEDKQKQIAELEKKVEQLKNEAQTLSGQIAYYDSQIALTSLKISQTETSIASISAKINLLEDRLQQKANLLEEQIVQTYKQGSLDPFQLFFSSANFSKFISRFKYAQMLQASNRQFLHDTQVVQSSYAQQKVLVEESRKKLEGQKASLDAYKAEKANLLKQTKNSESVYQKQLEQARLELAAIQQALALANKEGPVKAGDPIALVGNSGYPSCSTGKHLHFEVQVEGKWVNAENYLKNITDRFGLSIGSGNWDWPITDNITITQRYGKTPYSYVYLYSGGIHTGIDMISNNDIIRAVADGTLYSYVGKCGSSALNIKYIDHGNGLKTFYLHVQ